MSGQALHLVTHTPVPASTASPPTATRTAPHRLLPLDFDSDDDIGFGLFGDSILLPKKAKEVKKEDKKTEEEDFKAVDRDQTKSKKKKKVGSAARKPTAHKAKSMAKKVYMAVRGCTFGIAFRARALLLLVLIVLAAQAVSLNHHYTGNGTELTLRLYCYVVTTVESPYTALFSQL
jgi:hypothetical protein